MVERLSAPALIFTYVFALIYFADPLWQTNDDVAMAMMAHGYGIAAQGSPTILFSSVLWGYVVRALDGLTPLQGYSLATGLVLAISAWGIFSALRAVRLNIFTTVLAVGAIITGPILSPQFTVNAGLLSIAAVACCYAYLTTSQLFHLIVGCIFAFLGFLVRSLEFILIAAVALPLIPWKQLVSDRTLQIAAGIVAIILAAAIWADREAYRMPAWKAFAADNEARAPFTDYGAGALVKARPDLLKISGYSENDIDLLSDWFFADPKLYNFKLLRKTLVGLGYSGLPISFANMNTDRALQALEIWLEPRIFYLIVAAAVLLLISFRMRIALCWLSAIGIIYLFGLFGAPVHARVFQPVAALLLVVGFLHVSDQKRWARITALATAAAACVAVPWSVPPDGPRDSRRLQTAFSAIEDTPLFVWGGTFNYSVAYPLTYSAKREKLPAIYGLGVTTTAPFSVGTYESAEGRGLVERLLSNEGIAMVMNDNQVAMLSRYCIEHFGRELRESVITKEQWLDVRRVSCPSDVSAVPAST